MLVNDRALLHSLERDLIDTTNRDAVISAADLWKQQLDALKPADEIRTHDVAVDYRVIKTDGGGEVDFDEKLTPYSEEIHDACDDPNIRIVAIKGPARGSKSLTFENFLLKVGIFGPSRNVLWYMDTEPAVKRYVLERVNFFLERHPELWEKRNRKRRNQAWNLREIDGALWEWLSANASTTRGRSASLIVADEIDAMRPEIGNAIVTLAKNPQREYGSQAKLCIASHPDRGPEFGIDAVLRDSDMRVRLWTCPYCAHLMGPAWEVPTGRRMIWNVAQVMKLGEDMPRDELLDDVLSEESAGAGVNQLSSTGSKATA